MVDTYSYEDFLSYALDLKVFHLETPFFGYLDRTCKTREESPIENGADTATPPKNIVHSYILPFYLCNDGCGEVAWSRGTDMKMAFNGATIITFFHVEEVTM